MTWEKVKFSDLIDKIENGSRPKGGVDESGDIPSIGAEHLNDQGSFDFSKIKKISNDFFNKLNSGRINQDDIILVKDGATTGKVSYVDKSFPFKEASINEHVFCIRVNQEKLNSKYAFYYLFSEYGQREILLDFHGATVGGISKGFSDKVGIPLPPLSTQLHIASILDHANNLRQLNKQLLQKYDELAQSVFLEMFGDLVKNEKGWKTIRLSDCIEFLTSGSRGWAKYYTEKTGDVFLRINNVGRNRLLLDDIAYVNAPDNAESKRIKTKSGDVLLSITADLGRTAVIPADFPIAYINQHLALIRVKQDLINSFFLSAMISNDFGQNQIKKVTKGGVKSGLNFNDIKGIEIRNPSLEIQNTFEKIIIGIEDQRKSVIHNIEICDNLFQSLMQHAFNN